MFITIQEKELQAEIVEKKSKFIATIFYVQTEEEANNILKNMRKKYYDARHNCYAYRLSTVDGIIEKSSDDGEPCGTAGGPMLNILKGKNLCNILVVVTRYFGGILLGTGGLVRAYTEATNKALSLATYANETLGLEVEVEIEYTQLETLKYYCKKKNINIVNITYGNNIKCYLEATEEELNQMVNKEVSNCKILTHKIVMTKNIRKPINAVSI